MGYTKTITNLPDEFDPVIIIDEKMRTCPFCKRVVPKYSNEKDHLKYDYTYSSTDYRDAKGRKHIIFQKLNKYLWKRVTVTCGKCNTTWESVWYPADQDMFHVKIKDNHTEITFKI